MGYLIACAAGLLTGLAAGFLWGRFARRGGRLLPVSGDAEQLARAAKNREELGNFLRYDGGDLPVAAP